MNMKSTNPMHNEIEILSNQLARDLSKLKQKKLREETGKVVIEGFRLIDQLLCNGIVPEALITSDMKFTGKLPFETKYTGQIYQTSSSHMEQICDTKQPQDWAAIMSCTNRKIEENTFILYLDNVQDPGNMGTIFRTAAAAGISGIVRSSTCCELFNPKVIRASLGAIFFVPTEIHDAAYIQTFKGIRIAMCMDGDQDVFKFKETSKNILLILGSEAEGIHPEILESVDTRMKIPMTNQMESLNVSVTAGISMFFIKNQLKS
jgi:RNA methyltransferase, TrmH family